MDFGSFDEITFGTVGQGAQVATPGVQGHLLVKSGGNRFHGGFYQVCREQWASGGEHPDGHPDRGIREHSNELQSYRNLSLDAGGPFKRDKLWWYSSFHNQKMGISQPNFIGPIAGQPYNTWLRNFSGKVTYRVNPTATFNRV